MKQRVLVTGGAGYVGSVCSEELLRQGYEVTIVDDLSTGHRRCGSPGSRVFRDEHWRCGGNTESACREDL